MRPATFPFYYGWLVLAASAVSELLAQGATSYSAGLFVLPLQAEFHISRAGANSSILLLFLGCAVVAPLVGRMLDRYPIRLVMSAGAVIFSASLALIATTSSLWVMAATLVLPAAIGFMILGPMTTVALASRWFFRRRGLALGLATVATSGGGLVVVPVLSLAILHYGWRVGLLCEAAVLGVIIITLALTVLRDNPRASGLDGHPENQGRANVAVEQSSHRPRWREILGSRAFWIPGLTQAAISGTCQALVITLVPYGVQLGFTVTQAAFFISAFAVAAGVTKVLAGLLADRVNQYFLLIAASLFMMLSLLTLSLSAGYEAIFASACLAGIALGCTLPTAAGLIAAGFGSASFGTAMGWAYTLSLFFAILATRFIGSVYDVTHGYRAAFAAFIALFVCLLGAMLFLAPKKAVT